MTKTLTEKQTKFLDALYEEAKGDVKKAMEIAGYSKTTPLSVVIEPLADHIVELGRKFMAVHVPKAALGMIGLIDNPTNLGGERQLAAAKEVMDRAGLVKRDKVDVSTDGISGVFFLPAKNKD